MRFLWIGIRNFKSYGDYSTKINLDYKGVVFLLGKNGSGKTSFLDAILFAIYGKVPSTIDEIINRTVKKNCKVGFSFEIDGDIYKILRFREDSEYGNNVFLFKNGENITLRKVNDTQRRILEIVKISYNTMISSILFSSELYTSFMRSTITKRLNILENLLSIKELEKYQKCILDFKKPILQELGELNNKRIKLNTEVNTLSHTVKEYKQRAEIKLKEINDKIIVKNKERRTVIQNAEIKVNIDTELEKNKLYYEIKHKNEYINSLINAEKNKIMECEHLVLEKININNVICPTCKQEIKDKNLLNQKNKELDKQIKNIVKNNEVIEKNINELSKQIIKLPKRPKYKDEDLKKMKIIKDKHDKILSHIDNDIIILKERSAEVYDKNFVKEYEKRVKRITNVLNKINKKIDERIKEKEHYDVMGDLFSNNKDSIKKIIIEDRIEFFNNKINFYLPIFFDKNIKIQFDKNLNEKIFVNNIETSFGSFSSGEKMRIELSIAFSLFSLVRMFFHVPINFLVFDELLDQNLDKIGIEKVLQIINNFSKDSSIIIVSHNDTYKEAYTNRITVYKNEDGFSFLQREDE